MHQNVFDFSESLFNMPDSSTTIVEDNCRDFLDIRRPIVDANKVLSAYDVVSNSANMIENDRPALEAARLNSKRFMYYQNVRWLRLKTTELYLSSTSFDYDVVALTETNLLPSILDGELFNTNDYCVYRCDRSRLNSTCESGGGTLIAVRTNVASERVVVPGLESVEVVLVKTQFGNVCTFICCLYVPSNSPVVVYQRYTDALQRIIEFLDLNIEDRLYVLGDFNMTDVQWSVVSPDAFSEGVNFMPNSLLPTSIDTSANAELIYSLLGSGLHQVNGVKNFQFKYLDLIFCSDCDEVTVREAVPMVKVDKYHPPIEIEFSVVTDNVTERDPDRREYNFKKANYEALNLYLSQVDWNTEFSSCVGVDNAVDRFYEVIRFGFECFVPLKKFRDNTHPPWYSHRKSFKE